MYIDTYGIVHSLKANRIHSKPCLVSKRAREFPYIYNSTDQFVKPNSISNTYIKTVNTSVL